MLHVPDCMATPVKPSGTILAKSKVPDCSLWKQSSSKIHAPCLLGGFHDENCLSFAARSTLQFGSFQVSALPGSDCTRHGFWMYMSFTITRMFSCRMNTKLAPSTTELI